MSRFHAAQWPHVWRGSTLTQRVVWAVTCSVALLVGLQTVLACMALAVSEDEISDSALQREVQHVVAELRAAPADMVRPGLHASRANVSSYVTRGAAGVDALPLPVRGLPAGLYHLSPGGTEWHVAVRDTDRGRLTVVLDAANAEARVHQFSVTLAILWVVCVGVTSWIARAVATIAVGPILESTRRITSWLPGPARPATGNHDEAAELMAAFDRFRDRVDESIAREREFAANLDHEIRTPLTAIRTDAELLALEGMLRPDQQRRLQRIIGAVDDIIATTESTQRASRGAFTHVDAVDLGECIGIVADSLSDAAARAGLHLVNRVPLGHLRQLDRQALLTVLRNLVRNAIEHAAPATLTIDGDGHRIVLQDDGPGISAAALPHVFERYQQGRRHDVAEAEAEAVSADGRRRGLGLAIARRLCDLNGWHLTVQSPGAVSGRGTRFELGLDTRPTVVAQEAHAEPESSVVEPRVALPH